MNKKATAGDIFPIIFGILIFGVLLFVGCNAVAKAFGKYGSSQDTSDILYTALTEVANKENNLKLKLVSMKMKEGVGLYFFNGDSDLTESVRNVDVDSMGVYILESTRIIHRPDDCAENLSATCMCLCNGINLEKIEIENAPKPITIEDYKNIVNEYELDCDGGMTCQLLETIKLEETIAIENIVTEEEIKRIKSIEGNEIMGWSGGYSLFRADQRNEFYAYNLFIKTAMADVYVVNMGDTVRMCFDSNCYNTN